MRYRIVIEIETEERVERNRVNNLARHMADVAVTKISNPVFLSTELVVNTSPTIMIEKD